MLYAYWSTRSYAMHVQLYNFVYVQWPYLWKDMNEQIGEGKQEGRETGRKIGKMRQIGVKNRKREKKEGKKGKEERKKLWHISC